MINTDDKYKLFIESSEIGIFSFSTNHYFKEINSKFCKIIGYDSHELYSYKFPEPFWTHEFYDPTQDEIQSYKKNGILKTETYFQKKDQSYFPVKLYGCVISQQEQNETEYVILVEDITKQKKSEREFALSQDMLIALNKKLERIVQERTQQLHQVMKQKNEFINQLSHDLKNPLNPLITLLPVLNKETKDDRYKEILNVLLKNVKYMHELILNTIELAKLDAPHVEFDYERLNLNEIVTSIIENNFYIENEKHIQIHMDINPEIWIEIDKIRFNEVLINIISNAIKYGKEHGFVSIIATLQPSDSLQIVINDDGIGMTPDQLQKVFDEFYKCNTIDSTAKSCGLGMSICKRIIERHHGTITIDSPGLDQGTTVIIELPLSQKKITMKKDDEAQLKETISLIGEM